MSAGAAASAAAAAEQQRLIQQEEEEMTPYSADDLVHNWEFKIVRSAMGRFRSPAYLQKVLDNEARAGWVLVEKFDNSRIRLKRPEAARQRDIKLDFDPYRIDVGATQNFVALAIVGGIVCVMLLVVLFSSMAH
jgi:hypothetical protein